MAANEERIRTVEMHTGGEPLRVVVAGYPPIQGATILEKRRYALDHLDDYRKMVMWEPRGHYDMYGALIVDKDIDDADMAVLFIHNEGYSTMCGHGVIALGRYAIDYKLVKPVSPETQVKIQCPCGLVTAYTQYDSETGQTGQTRFESVPSFAFAVDQTIEVDGYGSVRYDIGYGGAFYVLVDSRQLGLDVRESPVRDQMEAADSLKTAVNKQVKLTHPESADLAFIYGVILTDGSDQYPGPDGDPTNNLIVFADKEVDRSPCGSGVTARIAVQFHKRQIQLGETRVFLNAKVGSRMTAKPLKAVHYGCYDDAVIVEVSGRGYYTGESSFWRENDDPLKNGFLVR